MYRIHCGDLAGKIFKQTCLSASNLKEKHGLFIIQKHYLLNPIGHEI